MELLQFCEDVGRETSLGLVAVVALTQGVKNTACFNAECGKAGHRGALIEGEEERSSYEGYNGKVLELKKRVECVKTEKLMLLHTNKELLQRLRLTRNCSSGEKETLVHSVPNKFIGISVKV